MLAAAVAALGAGTAKAQSAPVKKVYYRGEKPKTTIEILHARVARADR